MKHIGTMNALMIVSALERRHLIAIDRIDASQLEPSLLRMVDSVVIEQA
jgi:hypothetical protein